MTGSPVLASTPAPEEENESAGGEKKKDDEDDDGDDDAGVEGGRSFRGCGGGGKRNDERRGILANVIAAEEKGISGLIWYCRHRYAKAYICSEFFMILIFRAKYDF